jgi:putative PIN family toxin of toxin-antitoxin system
VKVVIDTNVVVSAHLNGEGLPAAILDLASSKIILMCISAAIMAEYEDVLRRPQLKLDPARTASSLDVIRNTSRLVKPTRIIAWAADESDDRFLECASAASADFIITGNTKHFPERFENIRIVTPREFIELIAPTLAQRRR